MDYRDLREHLAKKFTKYSQDIMELAKIASRSDIINPRLYEKYDVKRGLRDINGNGVVCGLTEISEIVAFGKDEDGNQSARGRQAVLPRHRHSRPRERDAGAPVRLRGGDLSAFVRGTCPRRRSWRDSARSSPISVPSPLPSCATSS